jgi:YceI-like domain
MRESKECSRYTVARAGSALQFEAKSSLHPVHGSVTDVRGFVEADLQEDGSLALDPAPRMHVEFPVERLRSGNDLQDREMWKLIDSRRFPIVSADLRRIKANGVPGAYIAEGDITLAGRSRRYSGEMRVRRNGENLIVDGNLVVDIRDFGLRPPQLLFIKVDPTVKVSLHLVTDPAG